MQPRPRTAPVRATAPRGRSRDADGARPEADLRHGPRTDGAALWTLGRLDRGPRQPEAGVRGRSAAADAAADGGQRAGLATRIRGGNRDRQRPRSPCTRTYKSAEATMPRRSSSPGASTKHSSSTSSERCCRATCHGCARSRPPASRSLSGDPEARAILDGSSICAQSAYVDALHLAVLRDALGARAEAFSELERATEENSAFLVFDQRRSEDGHLQAAIAALHVSRTP